jgi:hypothetical protein
MDCTDCATGPRDIAGHDQIILDAQQPSHVPTFHCVVCGQRYTREYQGSGVFVWVKVMAIREP